MPPMPSHNGQSLPGTELPYVVHVRTVAMEVVTVLAREEVWTMTGLSNVLCCVT